MEENKLYGVQLTVDVDEGVTVYSYQIVGHANDGGYWLVLKKYMKDGVDVYDLEFEPTTAWCNP